ncbi:MAG: IS1/IS1595 family N-terminal zinc-binding domain-containing protein [Pyrinomonadaceae bacterium]
MVTIKVKCRHCGSTNVARNGLTTNGKQRYLCSECGRRSRDNPQPNGYTAEERETILAAYHERSSLRGLTRSFGVARNTVATWLKKSGAAAGVGHDTARSKGR